MRIFASMASYPSHREYDVLRKVGSNSAGLYRTPRTTHDGFLTSAFTMLLTIFRIERLRSA